MAIMAGDNACKVAWCSCSPGHTAGTAAAIMAGDNARKVAWCSCSPGHTAGTAAAIMAGDNACKVAVFKLSWLYCRDCSGHYGRGQCL